MLVLTRYKDQKIKIGDDITICVVDVRGDKIRIGVEAPKDVAVDREELRESKSRGLPQRDAALPAPPSEALQPRLNGPVRRLALTLQ